MFRLFLLLVAAAVVFANPQMMFGLDEEWNSFKKVYGKNYAADGITELFRRGIWEKNLAYIQSHNLQADRGVHSYTLGMNHLGDMTREEFTHMLNGYTNNKSQTGSSFLPASNIGVLPKRVDWRKEGYVTHVKNQGQCGSCWAFSATGSLEGQHFKKTGKLVSLSEQNLVDCSGPEGNYGCNGGLMTQSFTYIAKNGGIDTEQSYPYIGRNGQCHFTEANIGATDVGFVNIPKMNESSLQQAVASVGPISAAMDASHSSWQFYQSGIYNEPACSSTTLDHGILVVGYGFSSEGEYWIVKNTYGVGWGMQGYVLMSRNKNNQCGIATLTSYPLV